MSSRGIRKSRVSQGRLTWVQLSMADLPRDAEHGGYAKFLTGAERAAAQVQSQATRAQANPMLSVDEMTAVSVLATAVPVQATAVPVQATAESVQATAESVQAALQQAASTPMQQAASAPVQQAASAPGAPNAMQQAASAPMESPSPLLLSSSLLSSPSRLSPLGSPSRLSPLAAHLSRLLATPTPN